MPRRIKATDDANVRAFKTVQEVLSREGQLPEKNPAAVALGRLGGLKGGKARAEQLSSKRRKEIAQTAALARWARQ